MSIKTVSNFVYFVTITDLTKMTAAVPSITKLSYSCHNLQITGYTGIGCDNPWG